MCDLAGRTRLREAAEKLILCVAIRLQALRRVCNFNDSTARVELVPFPWRPILEFFRSRFEPCRMRRRIRARASTAQLPRSRNKRMGTAPMGSVPSGAKAQMRQDGTAEAGALPEIHRGYQ